VKARFSIPSALLACPSFKRRGFGCLTIFLPRFIEEATDEPEKNQLRRREVVN